MQMDEELDILSAQVGDALQRQGFMLATAESCTGGWVAQTVTAVAGSSRWFERGFVTYTNIAKQEMLGVRAATLAEFGAVSEQTVREMAQGALNNSHAQISLAISGIAGPGGATLDKPVGMVCFAWAGIDFPVRSRTEHFLGNREAVRRQAVLTALRGVLTAIDEKR